MAKDNLTVRATVDDVEYTAMVDRQNKFERPVAISASTGETWAGEWDDGLYCNIPNTAREALECELFDAINAAVRMGR
jgi:hypothetical protein